MRERRFEIGRDAHDSGDNPNCQEMYDTNRETQIT